MTKQSYPSKGDTWAILVIAIFVYFIIKCTGCTEPEMVKPECHEVLIQYREEMGGYVVWWLPSEAPTALGLRLCINGNIVNGMCRRDMITLNISNDGIWSFYANVKDVICIDHEAQVFLDDCECESVVK